MKKILISIKPKYVAKILNNRKTLEIRKSFPKCDLPCEVYIYCTKDRQLLKITNDYGEDMFFVDKVKYLKHLVISGKVVAKFTLNKVEKIEPTSSGFATKELCSSSLRDFSCLTQQELAEYLGHKDGYAWHIDQKSLVIFDKPKELKEFGVKRSPQSYMFVEVEE